MAERSALLVGLVAGVVVAALAGAATWWYVTQVVTEGDGLEGLLYLPLAAGLASVAALPIAWRRRRAAWWRALAGLVAGGLLTTAAALTVVAPSADGDVSSDLVGTVVLAAAATSFMVGGFVVGSLVAFLLARLGRGPDPA